MSTEIEEWQERFHYDTALIDTLTTERDRLREENATLRAQLAAAVLALAPFRTFAAGLPARMGDDRVLYEAAMIRGQEPVRLTVGDVRRAAAVGAAVGR